MLKTTYFINNHEIVESTFDDLREYFMGQPVSKEIIEEILDRKFLDVNPSYYLYYPHLFKDFFYLRDTEILKKLSIAGFLYYKSTIYLDEIFDNRSRSGKSFDRFMIANYCQEETVKILSSIFDLGSEFWKLWNLRKVEFAKAYQLSNIGNNISSFEEFERLTDYKCAFGKIAIDALFCITDGKFEDVYNELLISHKNFYVAFQILDDIRDYEEDIVNSQFNIANYYLKETLIDMNDNLDLYVVKDQKKLLYLNGIVEKLYGDALHYLDKSAVIFQGNSLKENNCLWPYEIQRLNNTTVIHLLNIVGFLKVFDRQKIKNAVSEEHNTVDSVKIALKYIIDNQEDNGSWNDYFNNAGMSDVWATGFIACFLAELKSGAKLNEVLNRSKKFINEHKWSKTNTWGYNSSWIPDADSTSFALLALSSHGHNISQEQLVPWFSFQNGDGGFSTYNNKTLLKISLNTDSITDFDGWLQSHPCVSAVAYYLLCKLGIQNSESARLRQNLMMILSKPDKEAYWWNDFSYVSTFLLKAAIISKDQELKRICEDDIVLNYERTRDSENYFYIGLLVDALSQEKTILQKHSGILSDMVSLLKKNQKNDGSWEGNYSLRMPHPEIINPGKDNITWNKDTKGTNIIVKDFNGLFTTTVCLSAIYHFEQNV